MAKTALLNFDDDNFVAATQGSDFTASLTWTDAANNPIDLSTYTARMQIRRTYEDTLIYELNTVNSGIFMTNLGVIIFNIPYTVTATLPAGTFIYDFKLIDNTGVPTTLIKGQFVINETVTI